MSNGITTIITFLVRYGAVPEVLRCLWKGDSPLRRGERVVVQTHRGPEMGIVLEALRPETEPDRETAPPTAEILRIATTGDVQQEAVFRERSREQFPVWTQRIADWGLDLQLIDLEWTLDESRLILYVLNERGPECTKLALQAAAAGLGIIEVQPVSENGPVVLQSGGGCGSCGCH